ncbi:hypothetical protein [Herminiimonas sp. CN]|uniref:hypothetical protein n=1 Tax=Herminiimonas sp. CN TaxID=1349818 RepID=UPI0012DC2667|nr:hypothetical protein [Herminiimonas sp. CN]
MAEGSSSRGELPFCLQTKLLHQLLLELRRYLPASFRLVRTEGAGIEGINAARQIPRQHRLRALSAIDKNYGIDAFTK